MPNSDISEDNGGLVYEPTQSFTFIPTTQYLQLYLRKSSISLYVVRSFKKYDETLSYIGGLFSTIMTLLMIM